MCRLVAYFGESKQILDELLVNPENSLIKQSHRAREGGHGINADGFGIAWYNKDIDAEPGIFKSIQPAWNDNNIIHLARMISSNCILAHIRASTVGDVIQSNCHPFSYKEFSMVHNGTIRNFNQYKMQFIEKIGVDLFLQIKGNTDSEHFFFLIMSFVNQGMSLTEAVKSAIKWTTELQNGEDFSRINIVITDGKQILATRFASKEQTHLSLKYCLDNNALTISSEALDENGLDWQDLPEKHLIYYSNESQDIAISAL